MHMNLSEARDIVAEMLDDNLNPQSTFHGTLDAARTEALAIVLSYSDGQEAS